GDVAQASHVGRLPEQMYGHDSPCAADDDGFLYPCRIEQERGRIYVDERDPDTSIQRGRSAGDEREIRHDDLAAILETVVVENGSQGDTERIGAVSHEEPVR